MACTKNSYSNEQGRPSIHATDLPFYTHLMNIRFPDVSSAIKYCQNTCAEYGYTVKQEVKNASGTIYIVCEGFINENIKRYNIVLSETDPPHWTFHTLHESQTEPQPRMTGEEGRVQSAWPDEVNSTIATLTQHHQLEIQDIRDTIQRQFPDLIWNERRFQHQLMQERKRQKENGMAARVNRMVHLSAQLSAVVAANEESAQNVERDLIKMLDHFSHLAHIPPDRLDALVDLEEIIDRPTFAIKKRKSTDKDKHKGMQCVTIPGFNVHVRAQPLRASSLSSQGSRRTSESSALSSPSSGFPQRHSLIAAAAASHDSTNFVLSQQVDDLINLTYHHSIQGPFSPNDTHLTQAAAAQSFLGAGNFWPSVKDGHRSTATRFNNSPMPNSNDNDTCSDSNSNAIFY